eukprot:689262-Pleurochrysis_carterae.AAC.3
MSIYLPPNANFTLNEHAPALLSLCVSEEESGAFMKSSQKENRESSALHERCRNAVSTLSHRCRCSDAVMPGSVRPNSAGHALTFIATNGLGQLYSARIP